MSDSEAPLTPHQVAEIFGVTASAVRGWAATGRIKSFRTPGGQVRFMRSDVDEFLASQGIEVEAS